MIQLTANKFLADIDNDCYIEIGSSKAKFTPTIKALRWNEESGFELTLLGMGEFGANQSRMSQVGVENENVAVTYKQTGLANPYNDSGGLDILLTLKSAPFNNRLEFALTTQNCVLYEQPALSTQYKSGWSEEYKCDIVVTDTLVTRKEDGQRLLEANDYAIGGVAVYHNSKGRINTRKAPYKTGKLGYLFPMIVADSGGHTSIATWKVSAERLFLVFDPEFLEVAQYPLAVTPFGDTFGYTTTPTYGSSGVDTDQGIGCYATGVAGTAGHMDVYCRNWTSSAAYIKGVIWLQSDLTLVTNGVTDSKQVTSNVDLAWYQCDFSTSPTTTTVAYVIGIVPYYYHNVGFDNGSSNEEYLDTSNSYTSPASMGSATQRSRLLGVYVDVTTSTNYPITTTATIELVSTSDAGVDWDGVTSTGMDLSASVTRAASYPRTTSSTLDLLASVTKSWGKVIVTSAQLDLSALVTRVAARARTSAATLGLSAAVTKVYGAVKTSTANLGLSALVTRARSAAVTTVAGLDLAASVIRVWGHSITTTANLGLLAVVTRSVARAVTTSAGLGLSAVVTKFRAATVTTTAGLSMTASVLRSAGHTIATSALVGLSANVVRSMGSTITTVANLALAADVFASKVVLQYLTGIIAPAGALVKSTIKSFVGAVAPAGSITKKTKKTFAGEITPTGTFASHFIGALAVAGQLVMAGTVGMVTTFRSALSGALQMGGTLSKFIKRTLNGIIAPIGTLTRVFSGGIIAQGNRYWNLLLKLLLKEY